MANEDVLKFSMDKNVYLTKRENLYSVRTSDWKRLKKIVRKCKQKTDWWSIAASACIGISSSSLISVLTIPFDENKSTITKIILWAVFSCLLVIAIILYIVSDYLRKENNHSMDDVNTTIDEIEASFNIPNTEDLK